MEREIAEKGIVLSAVPYGEYGKRIVILTANLGRITAFANSIRKQTSRLTPAGQSFVMGEFRLRPGRDSYNLISADIEESFIELDGQLPDISDLEVENYFIENGRMKIRYNSNHVSSKEVLERICATSKIKSLSVRKADLAESIKSLNTGRK